MPSYPAGPGYLLSAVILLPLAGALTMLVLRGRSARLPGWVALVFSALSFLASVWVLAHFDFGFRDDFQYVENVVWIADLNIRYHIGADALALLLVLLNGLLSILSIFYSIFTIEKRPREFFAFLLILQTGVNGTFLALDLFLFYIFWELMLIPLYFLIGIWGSKNRIYATIKFVLYTLTGSLLMLVAILFLRFQAGTFDFVEIRRMLAWGELTLSPVVQLWLFLGFFLAFAIKVPMFPFHTWLPDAHTEAPTAGSVMLAGVLLKTGVYGMIRFCIPLFPAATARLTPLIAALGAIAIVYGAFTAIAQSDLKRLIAYSSVSHMGFIILGLFCFNEIGVSGAILQMINHGLSTGGLFLIVGMIYWRRHTRLLSEFGGLAQNLKVYAALTMVIVLSSVGLPSLNGFVGEFLILLGAFQAFVPLAVVGASGVILAAVYLLVMYQKVFFGPLDKAENKTLPDLYWWETLPLVVLIAFCVWIGVYPRPWLRALAPNSQQIGRQMDGHLSGDFYVDFATAALRAPAAHADVRAASDEFADPASVPAPAPAGSHH
ncbi:MAG: NADH-quinone oxidoreductase subunit M [Candidatus Sumerlaeia bacterium]